jgi:hypothetical protein
MLETYSYRELERAAEKFDLELLGLRGDVNMNDESIE